MARTRSWTWTAIISLLFGIAIATVFWLYTPYGKEQLGQQVTEDQKPPLPSAEVKTEAVPLHKPAPQAIGSNFQMVSDKNQIFVVDLKSGRVWRYFRQTKEEGFSREDEGFLPVPFYYAGKKHYSASEIAPPGSEGEPSAETATKRKQPQ